MKYVKKRYMMFSRKSIEILPPPPPFPLLKLEDEPKKPKSMKVQSKHIDGLDIVMGTDKPKVQIEIPLEAPPKKRGKFSDILLQPFRKQDTFEQTANVPNVETSALPNIENINLEIDEKQPKARKTSKQSKKNKMDAINPPLKVPRKHSNITHIPLDMRKKELVIPDHASYDSKMEIESAINSIKRKEGFSFFKNIFVKKEPAAPDPKISYDLSGARFRIEECKNMLSKLDLKGARTSYIELMKIYNSIPSEEKKLIYQEVAEIYWERKSIEGLGK